MNALQTIIQKHSISELPEIMKARGYGVAYGKTYSVAEIRKATLDGQRSIARIGSRNFSIVGAEKNGLVVDSGDGAVTLQDAILNKAWSGEAVIILEEPAPTTEHAAQEVKTIQNFVICEHERDTWPDDLSDRKQRAIDLFKTLNTLEYCELPSHPVIVIFRAPGEKEDDEHIRSMVNGAEITIFDPSDPASEFFHEVGHVYWRTRLNPDERKAFDELRKKLSLHDLPALFTTKWSMRDAEEFFCTVYMWYVKSRLVNPGYGDILKDQFEDGLTLFCDVMARIKKESEIQKAWSGQSAELAAWYDDVYAESKSLKTPDGRLLKAHVLHTTTPLNNTFLNYPFLDATVWAADKERQWVTIAGLGERVFVRKAGHVDVAFMKANRERAHLVPKTITMSHKKSGKSYQKKVWVKPSQVDAADAKPKSESGHTLTDEQVSKFSEAVTGQKQAGVDKEDIRKNVSDNSTLSTEGKVQLLNALDTKYPVNLDLSSVPKGTAQPIDQKEIKAVYDLAGKLGADDKARKKAGIQMVSLSDVSAEAAGQIRQSFNKDDLMELAESIHESGLLQPILVRPDATIPGKFKIIAGERRYRAFQMLKQQGKLDDESIPVIVRDVTDSEKDVLQLIENKVRKDNTPMELAEHYQKLVETHKMTPALVAQKTGVSESMVRQYMQLNKLEPTLKELLRRGEFSKDMGMALAGAPSEGHQIRIYNQVIRKGLNAKQTKEIVRNLKDQGTFFEETDTETTAMTNARKELEAAGEHDTGVLQQRFRKFLAQQHKYVEKFIDPKTLNLSTLGLAVSGDVDNGIKQVEFVMQQLGHIVQQMKSKNASLNAPDMFKALSPLAHKMRAWYAGVQFNRLNRQWADFKKLYGEA